MKCCGDEVTTPFCPLCGKKHKPKTVLGEILMHLRSNQKGRETYAKRQTVMGRTGRAERSERSAERYKRWADALEELMNSLPQPPETP